MGKVAFVFPGQGSQKVGMGKSLYEGDAAARSVFEEADAELGQSLSALCFAGPEADLQLTANTQPAILTTSIAALRLLERQPDVAAGHSLGEYSAHVCAGTVAFSDAVRTVRRRGQYMQEAVPVGQGAMAAVLRLETEAVEQICSETEGVVEPVNYNSPGQIVVAGEAAAVERASASFKAKGGRAIPLPVSAPFHSSLMRPAEDRLRPDLESLTFRTPSLPVVANVSAIAVSQADEARDALIRQVSRPVRWQQSVEAMIRDGVSLLVELGHGKVLSGLIGRISKEVECFNVQGPEDIEPARAAIDRCRAA